MPQRDPHTSARLRARVVLAVLGAWAVAASGCTEKVTEPPPPPPILAVPDSIQEVFTNSCGFDGGCHGGALPARGMQLGEDARRSWIEIVNVASETDATYNRISPGDSTNSYIVMKLRDDPRILGNPMPLGGYPLDPALVMRIAAWTAQGAPGVPVEETATIAPAHRPARPTPASVSAEGS
jgi:hypothetical protein